MQSEINVNSIQYSHDVERKENGTHEGIDKAGLNSKNHGENTKQQHNPQTYTQTSTHKGKVPFGLQGEDCQDDEDGKGNENGFDDQITRSGIGVQGRNGPHHVRCCQGKGW